MQQTVRWPRGPPRRRQTHHGAFLWISPAPYSLYSAALIHICWKVPSDARMEPPIQTEKRRSTLLAGQTTCIEFEHGVGMVVVVMWGGASTDAAQRETAQAPASP